MKYLLLLGGLWLGSFVSAQTSQDSTLYRVETTDGNEYIGTIVSQDNAQMVLNTEQLGTITLRKINIKRISAVNGTQIKAGLLWFENPQSTRYFWQPNGFGLRKGEGYYQNVWIFFNQVSYGITDNISIGAGMIPTFLFAGASTPVWITPKVSVPVVKDKFNVGLGALMGTVIGASEAGFGIAYGTVTLGNRNNNMSLGLGYGYASGEWANAPIVTFSAMVRTGQRGYILTENYFFPSDEGGEVLLFFGGRRLIKNTGLDFGLIFPAFTASEFFAIPWLGFTIPFGNTYHPGVIKK